VHLRADVDRTERVVSLREEPFDLRLGREVGLRDRGVQLVRERLGPVLTAVVVDEDARALRPEGTRAGGADAARRSRDDDSLAGKARVQAPYATRAPSGERELTPARERDLIRGTYRRDAARATTKRRQRQKTRQA
jgi:hypothetical protein